jgi:hypothetical protein
MADVVYVAILVGFFGLMVALVKACDAIIGPDPLDLDELVLDEPGLDEPAADRSGVRS